MQLGTENQREEREEGNDRMDGRKGRMGTFQETVVRKRDSKCDHE